MSQELTDPLTDGDYQEADAGDSDSTVLRGGKLIFFGDIEVSVYVIVTEKIFQSPPQIRHTKNTFNVFLLCPSQNFVLYTSSTQARLTHVHPHHTVHTLVPPISPRTKT